MHRSMPGLLLVLAACAGGPPRPQESGPGDRPRPGEGFPLPGESGPRRVIDFVVQGCSERTADRCVGAVPLSLTFSAVAQGPVSSLGWNFGDGSPTENALVVRHTYTRQGAFTVTLAAVISGGTAVEQKEKFVQAGAAGPGGACASTEDCASGTCVCHQSCPFPLSEGLCLRPCQQLACDLAGTACIDLSVPDGGSAGEWRTRLCLPTCSKDSECRPGFLCRQGPGPGGWLKACLPPFPRDIGQPCRGSGGSPDGSLCLGGLCLDIGASGYCSADCGVKACPAGSRCARLGPAGQLVCLLRCTAGACAGDPRLGCERPDPAGQWGFEIIGPPDPAGTLYCAPKRCLLSSECGLAGTCDLSKGGFCVESP